jgi:hypothetical protein
MLQKIFQSYLSVLKVLCEPIIEFFAFCYHVAVTKNQPRFNSNLVNNMNVLGRVHLDINDDYSVRKRYRITDESLINLAGGLPTEDFKECHFSAYSTIDDIFKIVVYYHFDDYNGLPVEGLIKRSVNFKRKFIRNEELQIQIKGRRLGTKIFINQVNEARRLGFNEIFIHAAGGSDYPPNSGWIGFKIWAKFGYEMDKYYQDLYSVWAKTLKLSESNLNYLYQKRRNYHLWEKYGFSWDGKFDLRDNSNSIAYLKEYLIYNHINAELSPFGSP